MTPCLILGKSASFTKVFLLMKTHFIAYFPYLMVNFLTVSLLFWNAVCRGPFSTQKDEFSHCCIEANENESRESWSIWSLFRKKYGYHNGFQLHLQFYRLKYGFCNKVISERWNSDQLNTFTTHLSSLLGMIAEYNSNHAQKWGQICCESVQLVRVSSFRNELLQNPYYSDCL